jgi:hypothetical protein
MRLETSPNLYYAVREQRFQNLRKALAAASEAAFQEGKTNSVLVYAKNAKGAAEWGGEKAYRAFMNRPVGDQPLAVIYVKATASLWG